MVATELEPLSPVMVRPTLGKDGGESMVCTGDNGACPKPCGDEDLVATRGEEADATAAPILGE